MTFEPPPKICPRCGEEYLPTVSLCVDCGVALIAEGEVAARAAAESEFALSASSELVAVRSAGAAWIAGLAESLEAAGVPCRVEVMGAAAGRAGRAAGGVRCTLLVRPEDADRAARVDVEFARTQIPDLPDQINSSWTEIDACPACGAALAQSAAECAECGLVFAAEE